jgi:hypothetical protein
LKSLLVSDSAISNVVPGDIWMPLPGARRPMSSGKVESQKSKTVNNFKTFASFQKQRLQAICMRKFAPVLANPWQEILARKRPFAAHAYSM